MAKQRRYRFYEKPHSKGGKFSSLMAALSALLLIACLIVSFAMRGNAGVWVGGLGLIAILISVYGFSVGMRSFREKGVSYSFSTFGSIACGIMSVAWLILFLAGVN